MIAPLLIALALAAGDPCAPVVPEPDDAAAAAEYRAVADAELARGARDTAEAAYRAAAARDPSDTASRAALARLCAEASRGKDAFAEGVRRMDAGDLRGAISAFEEARAAAADPSAALLEGICRYELGEDAAAEPLLREAEQAPAHRAEARFYRGLVALRAGDGADAERLFDSAAATPSLERLARDLARSARGEARLVASVFAESGWDTNVNLAPANDPDLAPEDDGAVALGGALSWRPRGASGPFLRASGSLHEQLTLSAWDFGALDGAAGWQLRRGRAWALAEYGYGWRTLGGEPFLGAHRLLASAGTTRGAFGASLTLLTRRESYEDAWDGFSGWLHRAEGRVSMALGGRARVSAGWGVARDDTDDPLLGYLEHGPRAELAVLATGRARVRVEAGATFRRYERFVPLLGARREDVLLDGALTGELDLAPGWTARLGLAGRHAASNVDALEYDKLVPTVGLSYVMGR